jgi:flagellar basal-body rod protein FlgG
MVGQQLNVDVIANNLANVNTTAFKRSRVSFQDLIYETIKPAAAEAAGRTIPVGIQVGHGVRPSAITKIFTPGNLIATGRDLDWVIEGDGFFQIQLPDGRTAYTRDGAFQKDENGEVVTVDGYPLEPGITVPDDALEISVRADGTVSARVAGQADPDVLGQIQLVRFINPSGLDQSLGRNLLLETTASGPPQAAEPGNDGVGTLEQGFLENSNVQTVEEILNLIIAQRAYEANSKVIQTSDEMLQTANNVRR